MPYLWRGARPYVDGSRRDRPSVEGRLHVRAQRPAPPARTPIADRCAPTGAGIRAMATRDASAATSARPLTMAGTRTSPRNNLQGLTHSPPIASLNYSVYSL